MSTFNPNQMPPESKTMNNDRSSLGPIVSVIVILAIIIIGGLYFLNQEPEPKYVPPADNAQTVDQNQDTTPKSDDAAVLEVELNAMNFDNLDDGAAAIEAELNAQ